MSEKLSSLEPIELPEVVKDAANNFLESEQERLGELLACPTLNDARVKIEAWIPEAQSALAKSNIKSGVASRAFVDAAVRRWIAMHPTEKSGE